MDRGPLLLLVLLPLLGVLLTIEVSLLHKLLVRVGVGSPEGVIDFPLKDVVLNTFLHELFDASDIGECGIFQQANQVLGLLLDILGTSLPRLEVDEFVRVEHSLLDTQVLREDEGEHSFDPYDSILNPILVEEPKHLDGLNGVLDGLAREKLGQEQNCLADDIEEALVLDE